MKVFIAEIKSYSSDLELISFFTTPTVLVDVETANVGTKPATINTKSKPAAVVIEF